MRVQGEEEASPDKRVHLHFMMKNTRAEKGGTTGGCPLSLQKDI